MPVIPGQRGQVNKTGWGGKGASPAVRTRVLWTVRRGLPPLGAAGGQGVTRPPRPPPQMQAPAGGAVAGQHHPRVSTAVPGGRTRDRLPGELSPRPAWRPGGQEPGRHARESRVTVVRGPAPSPGKHHGGTGAPVGPSPCRYRGAAAPRWLRLAGRVARAGPGFDCSASGLVFGGALAPWGWTLLALPREEHPRVRLWFLAASPSPGRGFGPRARPSPGKLLPSLRRSPSSSSPAEPFPPPGTYFPRATSSPPRALPPGDAPRGRHRAGAPYPPGILPRVRSSPGKGWSP